MLRLMNECDKCIHKNVCKYKNNQSILFDRLRTMPFDGNGDDERNWESMSYEFNVAIDFSCLSFKSNNGTVGIR